MESFLPHEANLANAMGSRWNSTNQRLARLDSVPNARDLGGLRTTDGRTIKHGRLFRSAVLASASENDVAFLRDELGINSVVDLRTAYEVNRKPDIAIEGTEFINMPIVDKRNNFWMEMLKHPGTLPEKIQSFARSAISKRMMSHMYTGFVMDEFCQLQYAAFLERLIDEGSNKNILWHCSQGKDRTGLISAFLMFALGCNRDTVVEEFALTNYYYKEVVDEALRQLYDSGGDKNDASVIEALLGVRVDYFEAALDHIDLQFGSMENYLSDVLVLTTENRKQLQSIYLE
ncbi:MAG: tyrosine-protein phosphatase [Bacteroidales bacterium]|nr:tyrosine-protein phosphatase [Bacteroidales bacterium]